MDKGRIEREPTFEELVDQFELAAVNRFVADNFPGLLELMDSDVEAAREWIRSAIVKGEK